MKGGIVDMAAQYPHHHGQFLEYQKRSRGGLLNNNMPIRFIRTRDIEALLSNKKQALKSHPDDALVSHLHILNTYVSILKPFVVFFIKPMYT